MHLQWSRKYAEVNDQSTQEALSYLAGIKGLSSGAREVVYLVMSAVRGPDHDYGHSTAAVALAKKDMTEPIRGKIFGCEYSEAGLYGGISGYTSDRPFTPRDCNEHCYDHSLAAAELLGLYQPPKEVSEDKE